MSARISAATYDQSTVLLVNVLLLRKLTGTSDRLSYGQADHAAITTDLVFTDGISDLFSQLTHLPVSLCCHVIRSGEVF